MAGPLATNPAQSFQMSGGDVWRVIRSNIWLIIIMLIISCGIGIGTFRYLSLHYSTYKASARVKMAPLQDIDLLHPDKIVGDPNAMEVEKYNDIQRFKNQNLQDNLLNSSEEIRKTSWWKVTCQSDPAKAHEWMNDHLEVSSQPMTQIIDVSFTTPERTDCKVIVNAIVDAVIANQKDYISDKFSADHARLFEQETKYRYLKENALSGLTSLRNQITAAGGDVSGRPGIKDMELDRRVQYQITLQQDMVRADEEYAQMQQAKEKGEVLPMIPPLVEADPDVLRTRTEVDSIKTYLQTIGPEGQHGDTYKRNEHLLNLESEKLDSLRATTTARIMAELESKLTLQHDRVHKEMDLVTSQINQLKNDIADISNLTARYRIEQDNAATQATFEKQYTNALAENEGMTQKALSTSLTHFEDPRDPTSPSFPKLNTIMLLAVFIGLALSLGIAFLRELTDTTVRSPRDIVRIGQMNFLGMVPHESDDPQSSGARLPLVIFEAPHSIMAEQLRQVRTRLQHTASMDTTRSILVTSASPGDGKSTIAVNLAAGLALNGRRILLVDSNFRRPELHRIFGIGNESGFSDVLSDVNSFATAVRETPVPNLSVMASGPKPSNPTELLESQWLLDFIERALEEYDHVIFDSGPMLFVSESVALAPRVDGVITVVRARTSSRGVLQRMRDSLRAVKAEHLGVVLNGVRSQAGGYYGRSIKTYYAYQNG
jgi:capsular exopolysaccharide synthesis family protein